MRMIVTTHVCDMPEASLGTGEVWRSAVDRPTGRRLTGFPRRQMEGLRCDESAVALGDSRFRVVVLGGEFGAAARRPAVRAFDGDTEGLHEEAVFVAVLATENDIALGQAADDRKPGIAAIFDHGTGILSRRCPHGRVHSIND